MSRKFNRIAEVVIQRLKPTTTEQRFFIPLPNPVVIKDLQIKFSVEKNSSGKPNTCDIEVTNLASATRTEIAREGLYVRLNAGYDGIARFLFSGNVTWSYSNHNKTEWSTKIQVGDGALAYREARVNRSYKAGTTVLTVLRDAAKSMGLTIPAELETSNELKQQFAAGFVFSDFTRNELTRLLAPFGYNWSIQNGRLSILKDEQVEGQAILISEETGMIGTPEFGKPEKGQTKPKLEVPVALTPELNPGSLVELRSRAISGFFKCQRVKHEGDTHGEEFKSTVELVPRE